MVADERGLLNWLLGHVGFFRELGFYGHSEDLSDDELASKLRKYLRTEWHVRSDHDFDTKDRLADHLLLKFDDTNLWWDDTEVGLLPPRYYPYTETLRGFSKISNGMFIPSKISEAWRIKDRTIDLKFKFGKAIHVYHPWSGEVNEGSFDWLDLDGLLEFVNRLVKQTRHRFVAYPTEGQDALVLFLGDEQMQTLRKGRGCKFWG